MWAHHITIHLTGDSALWLTGIATAVLAVAGLTAVWQLREVKRDRHVGVFAEMGRRWEGAEMTQALQKERDYNADELAALFATAMEPPTKDPTKEAARKQAAKDVVVLLRVPNYFEDADMLSRAGSLKGDLFAENFGSAALDEWARWKTAIKEMRLREKDSSVYEGFQRLANAEESAESQGDA